MRFCFIGGAPKSGTSSLFQWLKTHPEIDTPLIKETFFFIDKNNPLINENENFYKNGVNSFIQKFSNSNKICLEGTTHLLYQNSMIDVLKNELPNSKFVFVLRNPVERLVSSFNFTKNNLLRVKKQYSINQYIKDLKESNENNIAANITDDRSAYVLSRDLRYGHYSTYLSHWISVFSNENIKVILFEDLKANPQKIITEVCDFLAIDSSMYLNYSFVKENESLIIKNRALFKLLKVFKVFSPSDRLKKTIKYFLSSKDIKNNDVVNIEMLNFLKQEYTNEKIALKKLGVNSEFKGWV